MGAPALDESQASPIGASSLAPPLINCVQLDGLGSSTECFDDPGGAISLNDDMQNPDKAVIERGSEIPQPLKSELIFLFEKKLMPTDCDSRAGRFLVPKFYAEKFLPMVPGQHSVPITIKDTKGHPWDLMLRWWQNKNSRKYVLDGTKACVQEMQWNVGDVLKFYRKLPENELTMDLIRTHAGVAASSAPATRNCESNTIKHSEHSGTFSLPSLSPKNGKGLRNRKSP